MWNAFSASKEGGDRAGVTVKHSFAEKIDCDYGFGRCDGGKSADHRVAIAEIKPTAKQDVIQRHVAFATPENSEIIGPSEAGDSDADAFVHRETARADHVEAEGERDGGNRGNERGAEPVFCFAGRGGGKIHALKLPDDLRTFKDAERRCFGARYLCWSSERPLFVAQSLDRVNFRGATRGNVAGGERHDGKDQSDDCECGRVGWRDTEKQAAHQPSERECGGEADDHSDQREARTLLHDERQ